jgi:hypothetical protein
MKKLLFAITLFAATTTKAQEKKQDSLVLQITMDTTTFKNVVALIQENINGNTTTGKLLLQSILAPLYNNAKLVADKPKETIKK